ncbi:Dynein beta chain, ciliary [Orchesella cincta]|uniref:Dynein beta chain, ciliary n=1 Tax=Orchesella cincta TaxID=48709 RepID=A0A1D2NFD6_ORCCI|nr:Dynein beta chain, ciliary [Orchesella cincta]
MAGKKEAPVYEPGVDLRLDFVYGYIIRSFRIKPDKWNKFLSNEDYKAALFDFFENPQTMVTQLRLRYDKHT